MLALGLHGEEAVEGDDTIDLSHRHVQLMGDDFLDLSRQVAELALHLVEDIDDFATLITKALADVFDNVDFLFGYFDVSHFSFSLSF